MLAVAPRAVDTCRPVREVEGEPFSFFLSGLSLVRSQAVSCRGSIIAVPLSSVISDCASAMSDINPFVIYKKTVFETI